MILNSLLVVLLVVPPIATLVDAVIKNDLRMNTRHKLKSSTVKPARLSKQNPQDSSILEGFV